MILRKKINNILGHSTAYQLLTTTNCNKSLRGKKKLVFFSVSTFAETFSKTVNRSSIKRDHEALRKRIVGSTYLDANFVINKKCDTLIKEFDFLFQFEVLLTLFTNLNLQLLQLSTHCRRRGKNHYHYYYHS